jgi:hypothetical protein
MTPQELAAQLNGREYGSEVKRGEGEWIKQHGLVVAYGASDDLLEFEGAISDEVGAYNGTTVTVDVQGLRPGWEEVRDRGDEAEARRYFERQQLPSATVTAHWRDGESPVWLIEATVPHATFTVLEEGEPFCQGVVFQLADIGVPADEGDAK